jgi:hypothetical protein
MNIKTKKYQLTAQTYTRIGFMGAMREFWWAWFVPLAIIIGGLLYPPAFWWCFSIAMVLSILYLLFWYIQFAGVAQMEQNKTMFDRMMYEINSKQILVKLNERQGMQIGWDKINAASKGKDHYLLSMGRGQFFYLPFSIFRSEHDMKMMDMILRKKNYLPGGKATAATAK